MNKLFVSLFAASAAVCSLCAAEPVKVENTPAPAQNPAFFRSYGHFDGIKRDVWEGGLRVPCLVWAPGIVKAGKVSKRPSQFHDWMATFADLAGVPKPMRCDGVSLLPMLKGRDAEQKDGVVYSEYNINAKMDFYDDYAANKRNRTRGEQQVIVFRDAKGRFLKALRTNVKTGEENFEIYDVEADPHESKNLADEYADMQEKLRTAALYNRVWDLAIRAAIREGGVINEHHGVGLKLGRLMKELYGPAMGVLEDIKKQLDPNNIMNPGKMGFKGV